MYADYIVSLISNNSMHRIILIALMLIPFVASAQVGTVRYTHTYPLLHGRSFFAYEALSHEKAGLEFVAPETHATISRSMVFDTNASLMYTTDREHAEPGHRKVSEGSEHIDTTYVDFDGGVFVESRVLNVDIYLVSDQQPAIPWQLESEERSYLGFHVMKATAVVDSASIEAWFTPEIPIPAGPGLYSGLPGLILMVTNAAEGEVYAAEVVDMGELARAITPPTRGATLSDKDYHRTKAAEIAEEDRNWNKLIRDIEEGRIIFIKRGGQ